MKILNQWAASLSILLVCGSCEEVIELDLGNAAPRIVIEGVVSTDPGPYLVKINQSVDYGDTNLFPPISGALVTVTDEQGFSELLEEVADGVYSTNELQGEHGKSYSVKVVYDEKEYTASSTIQDTSIPIQSITYTFEEESLFTEEGYYITAFFADPIDEVNFYRLKVFVNGEPYFFEEDDNLRKDDNFWLINDQFFNGKIMDFEFPHKLKVGDRVDVELHQVDQATYDYYRTLVELMGFGGVAPSNPLTNWSNGALGYFGAISVTYASVVIEEGAG
jgi:hypothetical protein